MILNSGIFQFRNLSEIFISNCSLTSFPKLIISPILSFKNLIRKILKKELKYEEKTKNITYETVLNMTQYYPEIELKDKKSFVTCNIINDKTFIKDF